MKDLIAIMGGKSRTWNILPHEIRAMEAMETTLIPTVPTGSGRSQRPLNIMVRPDGNETIQRQGSVLFYRMDRHIKTVTDLWREWTVGLNDNLSLMVLNWHWGSQWRSKCSAEQQWYST
jgi:hypothetical protein